MNRPVMLGAGLGLAVLIAGGACLYLLQVRSPDPASRPSASTATSQPAGAAAASSPWSAAPHWQAPAAAGPSASTAPAGRSQPAAAADGGVRMTDIQKRLQSLAASGQPDVRELDAVLADLQRQQGKSVVAGVDLQALRDNLARSQHIQELARQMQTMAANPSPETTPKLQALMAEIQQTQSQMQAIGAPMPRGRP